MSNSSSSSKDKVKPFQTPAKEKQNLPLIKLNSQTDHPVRVRKNIFLKENKSRGNDNFYLPYIKEKGPTKVFSTEVSKNQSNCKHSCNHSHCCRGCSGHQCSYQCSGGCSCSCRMHCRCQMGCCGMHQCMHQCNNLGLCQCSICGAGAFGQNLWICQRCKAKGRGGLGRSMEIRRFLSDIDLLNRLDRAGVQRTPRTSRVPTPDDETKYIHIPKKQKIVYIDDPEPPVQYIRRPAQPQPSLPNFPTPIPPQQPPNLRNSNITIPNYSRSIQPQPQPLLNNPPANRVNPPMSMSQQIQPVKKKEHRCKHGKLVSVDK